MSSAEAHLREHLANPNMHPRKGEAIRTDQQIVDYLDNLDRKYGRGTRSAWETDLMNRLKAKIKREKRKK